MNKTSLISKLLIFIMLITSCNSLNNKIKNQSDFKESPKAEKRAKIFEEFGNKRTDNYFWLRDRNLPEVIDYLNAENAYCQTVMASTEQLQNKLYSEIKGRIKEDDESSPQYENGYFYYSKIKKGEQYNNYYRKKGNLQATEEIIFDVNKMAANKDTYVFEDFEISPNNNLALYSYNEDGSLAEYTLKIKDLSADKDLIFERSKISSACWANDSKTIFYTIVNEALRPYRVYRCNINNPTKEELVYEEKDERFNCGVYRSKNNKFILISSYSSTTSEVNWVEADKPNNNFKVAIPRKQDAEYSIYPHISSVFIKYKDKQSFNSKIYEVDYNEIDNRHKWKEIVAHNDSVKIEAISIFEKYLAVETRTNGLTGINIYNLSNLNKHLISFPEAVYTAYISNNPDFKSEQLRYGYSSPNRPNTVYEYNMSNDKTVKLKEQEIPSGFNPDNYKVERLWATSHDGVLVPMAIVYKKGLKKDGNNPALIYSYGSYGSSSDAYFIPSFYSLIDRGFVFAIAQIRGGSDLGEQWYENGKLLNKKNTFYDFIACTEKLIADKYTKNNKIAAMGGSAGGLLMGAICNMKPELFQTIIAQVPFVDVINTMLDSSLPLTTQEYEEWGNPNEEKYYKYMLSYSPYDNVTKQKYPNILATSGLNDSQVGFHEPAKWVAKLREMKTDNNIVLLKTNMESGHGGATGRFDKIKEKAFEIAFILNRVGINK